MPARWPELQASCVAPGHLLLVALAHAALAGLPAAPALALGAGRRVPARALLLVAAAVGLLLRAFDGAIGVPGVVAGYLVLPLLAAATAGLLLRRAAAPPPLAGASAKPDDDPR